MVEACIGVVASSVAKANADIVQVGVCGNELVLLKRFHAYG